MVFLFSSLSLFNWRGSCFVAGFGFHRSRRILIGRRSFFVGACRGEREGEREKFLVHVAERRREGKRKRRLSSYQSLDTHSLTPPYG